MGGGDGLFFKFCFKKVKKDLVPIEIKQGDSENHIQTYADQINSGQICPIFIISSVTL